MLFYLFNLLTPAGSPPFETDKKTPLAAPTRMLPDQPTFSLFVTRMCTVAFLFFPSSMHQCIKVAHSHNTPPPPPVRVCVVHHSSLSR